MAEPREARCVFGSRSLFSVVVVAIFMSHLLHMHTLSPVCEHPWCLLCSRNVLNQRQTGISVSYRKHRYQGLWYQYRSRLGHFLGLGISIGIGRATCTSFWVICNNSLLSKVSVSVSVPGHFPGISISIGLDWDQLQVSVSVSVSIQSLKKYQYQYRIKISGPVCLW